MKTLQARAGMTVNVSNHLCSAAFNAVGLAYVDIGIAWALQSFIGSLALAKYLEGKGLEQ